jgi:hypothetical protein
MKPARARGRTAGHTQSSARFKADGRWEAALCGPEEHHRPRGPPERARRAAQGQGVLRRALKPEPRCDPLPAPGWCVSRMWTLTASARGSTARVSSSSRRTSSMASGNTPPRTLPGTSGRSQRRSPTSPPRSGAGPPSRRPDNVVTDRPLTRFAARWPATGARRAAQGACSPHAQGRVGVRVPASASRLSRHPRAALRARPAPARGPRSRSSRAVVSACSAPAG